MQITNRTHKQTEHTVFYLLFHSWWGTG